MFLVYGVALSCGHEELNYINCGFKSQPGRSVSIVSGYGLGDREIEVRFSAEAKGFFLQPVSRSALGPTQPPVQWVPRVLSQGLKRGQGVTLTTHQSSAKVMNEQELYFLSPQAPLWRVVGQL
jgi:hypothetical protein